MVALKRKTSQHAFRLGTVEQGVPGWSGRSRRPTGIFPVEVVPFPELVQVPHLLLAPSGALVLEGRELGLERCEIGRHLGQVGCCAWIFEQ